MALIGIAASIVGLWSVSALISQMGGDPEGDEMLEIQKDQGLQAARAQRPLHRLETGTMEDEKEMATGLRQRSAANIGATQASFGRRGEGPSDMLDQIAAQMGTTPEELSAKLSPERAGDLSNASRIAYGRSAKRLKG